MASRRTSMKEPLVQSQGPAHRGGEDGLHVKREGRDGPFGQRRTGAVAEEQDPGEQADAEGDPDQGGERPARIAHQIAPDVAEHLAHTTLPVRVDQPPILKAQCPFQPPRHVVVVGNDNQRGAGRGLGSK